MARLMLDGDRNASARQAWRSAEGQSRGVVLGMIAGMFFAGILIIFGISTPRVIEIRSRA